jgi:hypothetical protein
MTPMESLVVAVVGYTVIAIVTEQIKKRWRK